MRPGANSIECDGVRTVVEVRDCLQDMAIGVERSWPADATGGVLVRIQSDLGIDEIARGDPVVQSFAKRSGGGHVCVSSETGAFGGLSCYTISDPKTRGRDQMSRDTYLDPGDLGLVSKSVSHAWGNATPGSFGLVIWGA